MMLRTIFLSGIISLLSIFQSCEKDELITEDNDNNTPPPSSAPNEQKIISSSNAFGFDLYKEVASQSDADENILLSPLSVSMALAMTKNGAEGVTYEEIKNTLRLDGTDDGTANQSYRDLLDKLPGKDPDVTTQIANSIWYREGFSVEEAFITTNEEYYDAEVSALDFSDPGAAKGIINDWVNNKTNNKIPEIIETIDGAHVMFLINAVYFEASWTKAFDEEKTEQKPFTLQSGQTVEVDMMSSDELSFGYYEHDDLEVISLPYGNEKYYFTALLPAENSSITDLSDQFTSDNWSTWVAATDTSHNYTLEMPKFELEYDAELNDMLIAMGMPSAFGNGANFGRINPGAQLAIDKVKHKTFIRVDEAGTEAAGATSVGIVITSANPVIQLNRPYIYVIHEKETGAILFTGRMMNPTQ